MPQFRLLPYAGISISLATWVVLLALHQRPNFYAAAVHLSKSNACMLILWNFGIFVAVCIGKAMQKFLFGTLRLIEVERLNERAWYTVTESLLALTIFREEFDTSFVFLFVSLIFVKIFHWLASDRVESMEQTPELPNIFHIRMMATLTLLWGIDLLLIVFASESILLEGPSVMILFASEYIILLASVWSISAKYIINTIDLSSDVPWESKSVMVFYVELITDFWKLTTYIAFFCFIMTFYGLPLNILRDVYVTTRSFLRKVRDLHRYRLATKNMDDRYPNATQAEMDAMTDRSCIICREEMLTPSEAQQSADTMQEGQRHDRPTPTSPAQRRSWRAFFRPKRVKPNETPKRLPCAHVFHFHCLKSWLERQQTCPTCRRNILDPTATPSAAPAPAPQPAAAAAAAPGQAAQADPVQAAMRNVQRPFQPFLRPTPAPTVPPLARPVPANANLPDRSASPFTQTAFQQRIFGTSSPETLAKLNDNPLWKFAMPSDRQSPDRQKSSKLKIPVVASSELGIPPSLLEEDLTHVASSSAQTLDDIRTTPMRAELIRLSDEKRSPSEKLDPSKSVLKSRLRKLEDARASISVALQNVQDLLDEQEV